MSTPTVVLLVKFKSLLSLEEIRRIVDSRIDRFRALEALTQKYYLQGPAPGEYAGLYLWESSDALAEFRDSELKQSIAAVFQSEDEPRIEVFQIFDILRD